MDLFFKQCGCGRTFNAREWAALEDVGEVFTEDETGTFRLEMRNCDACRSTLGIEAKVEER
jgi:hypothetical protein